MAKFPGGVLRLAVLLAVPVVAWGCGEGSSSGPAAQGPPGGPPGGGWSPPGGSRGDPKLKEAMAKIGRGPNSLSSVIDRELKADQPSWDAIRPRTAEYVALTADLDKLSPGKGTKESWVKHATAYAEETKALDAAAKAGDLPAARAAQKTLTTACTDCHNDHRGGPGGRGGRPGGPPGGPPPGGPPPGPPQGEGRQPAGPPPGPPPGEGRRPDGN